MAKLIDAGRRAVVRVDLTDGDWVDLKARLSVGERVEVQTAAFKTKLSLGQMANRRELTQADIEGTDLEISLVGLAFRGMEIAIVGWSFAEPVTPEAIRRLDPVDYDLIAAEMRRLYQPRTDDEKNG